MANPIKKLFGEIAIYGVSSIVGRLLNYLLVPLYTYVFVNPADYGVVSELYAWVAFLIVILTFGMETAFFKFLQNEKDKASVFSTSFSALLTLNSLFFFLILIFNEDIAGLMLYENHGEYIIMLGAIVGVDAICALPLAQLRAEEKAKKFSIIQLSSIAVNIVLNLVFLLVYFNPENPEQGVFYIFVANLLASSVKLLFLSKSFSKIAAIDWSLLKRMVFYSFPLAIAGFAGIINETLDRILLKQILFNPENPSSLEHAEAQVGMYSASYKLAMLVTILLQAYRYAAEPFFFNQMKNENRNKIYSQIMNVFIAVVCIVFLLVTLNIDVFKYFIQNEAYWVGLKVVPILLMANIFLGIYFNQSIWYKLSGKTQFGAYIALTGAFLTVVINVLYIPKYGYMACAWATLIVYFVQMVISYLLGQKHYPIPYNLKKVVLYIGLSLLIYALSPYLRIDNFTWNIIVQNCLLVIFAVMVYLLEWKRRPFL